MLFADDVFELMRYVDNTVHYEHPEDVLDWTVMIDLIEKAFLRYRRISKDKTKKEPEDRDIYP